VDPHFQKILSQFVVLSIIFVACIAFHGEDLGTLRAKKPPTPNQGLIRVGYLLSKMLVVIYAAGLMLHFILKLFTFPNLTKNEITLDLSLFMILSWFLIQSLQNLFRKIRGLPPMLYFDLRQVRHNLSQPNKLGRK
jgi:hypothetical protein